MNSQCSQSVQIGVWSNVQCIFSQAIQFDLGITKKMSPDWLYIHTKLEDARRAFHVAWSPKIHSCLGATDDSPDEVGPGIWTGRVGPKGTGPVWPTGRVGSMGAKRQTHSSRMRCFWISWMF